MLKQNSRLKKYLHDFEVSVGKFQRKLLDNEFGNFPRVYENISYIFIINKRLVF